ncbi:MAG: stearoyl-CoA 9-desaturase oxidoreductase [Pseudonocardiales bacterium]|jgi:ferredoxin-NADP reductase|nr:stearoyl-CoA 9-desaturase oxidoreductase [Pseudonocardiales bacterium]
MVETGAKPQISPLRRRFLSATKALTTPLLPDDYLALLNPRWSTRELTGTVVRVRRETDDATTVVVKPDSAWSCHQAGQYVRLGMEINGIRHWRAYTITSDPEHPEGVIAVTVKHTEGGRMSPVFVQQVRPGQQVFIGEVEGTFGLPTPCRDKQLFMSAGSGITPIMSMLREMDRRDCLDDALHIHSCRSSEDMIFGKMLRRLAQRREGYHLHEIHTGNQPRFSPDQLDELCPDWREREAFLSGPRELIDAVQERYEQEGRSDQLHTERFQPIIGTGGGEGTGGTVHFRVTDCETKCDPGKSILVGGEEAGATLMFGCRMGICHTCVGRLREGAVRDLRSGEITEASGQMIRVCINAPEGHVEVDL